MAGRRQEKNKATALPLPPPQNAPERPENSEQQITAFLAIQLNDVKLWVHLEGQASAKKVGVANAEDLDDLRPILQSKFRSLRSVEQGDIQFFVRKSHTNPLPPGTTIEEIQANNTDKVPLIVRYPLSNDTVDIEVTHIKSHIKISLAHSTGTWYLLRAEAKEKLEKLHGAEFYFMDKNQKDRIVDDEFEFNALVARTAPNDDGERLIQLKAQLKGKRPYGDWTSKDLLTEILNMPLGSIEGLPCFDIESIPDGEPLSDEDTNLFLGTLEKIAVSLHNHVSTNEATARCYIHPFMHTAVAHVRSSHPTMRLSLEEDFDGSRGYGRLDYVVHCHDIAVLVTEAKMESMGKGVVQNIIQLHTAAEKLLGKRKRRDLNNELPSIYGIVTTGEKWKFIHWSGPPTTPSVKVSKSYVCGFDEEDEEANEATKKATTKVLSLISRLLHSQGDFMESHMDLFQVGENEVAGDDDDNERDSQRARIE